MSRRVRRLLVGMVALLALAACGRGFVSFQERPQWRHDAEAACLKSGSVKVSRVVAQMDPIAGPGMCGADFPLKVAALGEGNAALGYNETARPPAGIPERAQPRWPIARVNEAPAMSAGRYAPQVLQAPGGGAAAISASGEPMVIAPPREGARFPEYGAVPPPSSRPGYAPAAAPFGMPARNAPAGSMPARSVPVEPDADDDSDIPDDAVLPDRPSAPATRPAYNLPATPQTSPQISPPRLGPARGLSTGSAGTVTVSPAATLACPIVSALDQWMAASVQPAALRWFGQPVVEIKQISAYSCRGMNGNPNARISEHAFGNALDIAAFVLADGRRISVKNNWNGRPEEQGFLHDVQGGACDTFTTVLAPGSNRFHYDHIHVDLMRRASGRLICQPRAIDGRIAAARAASKFAARGSDPGITGSIKRLVEKYAVAGEDGAFDDEDEAASQPQKALGHKSRK